ncbi:MAG: hypothetical protein ASARMPRED_009242 [Alectoria sarmentosa]|nr:MAG: hypothetical protein ASARMPRED_009242 [Alectoria sarmentosa]
MGSLFPSSFEHSLNCFGYLGWAEVPNVRFFEVVFDKVTARPRIEEGLLHEKNIKAWLDKVCSEIREKGLSKLLEDYTENGSMINLSLPKEILRSILQHFNLPPPYLSTKTENAARCAMIESRSDSGHRLLSFLTRDDFTVEFTHALALTHNLQTSVTSSIMIGHPDYLKYFIPYIKERLDLVRNPSFLVLVIGQLDINCAETEYHSVRMKSADVEDKTGHGANFIHQNPGDLKQLDLPEMTKSVHALASSIARAERNVNTFLLRVERLAEFEKKFQEALSPENSLEWDSSAQEMRQHTQWQVDLLRSLVYEYENCAKAATSQMSIIYSHTSQRESELNVEVAKDSKSIAAASKRDSSAMKSIALLTMLFLPATFVSTVFAMPILDWNADRASAVVTRHAWLYLAVTLPLTIMVLSVWFGWVFVSERMHRKTDENARASLFPKA